MPTSAKVSFETLLGSKATPKLLRRAYAGASHRLKIELKAVVMVPKKKRTFANTLAPLQSAYDRFHDIYVPVLFLESVSPDKGVRDAAHALSKEASLLLSDLAYRRDIYKSVRDYAGKAEILAGENRKLLDETLKDYRRAGMELPAGRRARLKGIEKELLELCLDFQKNIRDHVASIEVAPAKLSGVSPDLVKSLKAGSRKGTVRLILDYSTFEQVAKLADHPDVRRQAYFEWGRRAAPINIPLLTKALKLRREKARLLGYPDFAAYQLEERMAKTPANVKRFLLGLQKRALKPSQKERAALLRHKRRHVKGAGKLEPWDILYYSHRLKKKLYAFDPEKVREYFPMEGVIRKSLAVYQKLLGIRFQELSIKTWHPQVRSFDVFDAASDRRMGRFHLDLFPRDGKFKHMAVFGVIKACERPDGGYRMPLSAMVGNFSKASGRRPALLLHSEVETFFHEFGHLLHQTLTQVRYSRFSGTSTARDFSEAPSQMMENFVWSPEALAILSGHYKNPSRKLPKKLLGRMLKAKNFNAALFLIRQVAYSTLDMAYHTKPPKDTSEELRRIYRQVGIDPPKTGVFPEASFGHIMGGYQAGYYGYLWSLVYAQDIFSRFESEGILDPTVGLDYRRTILERGGSADENSLLKDFLGRPPNEDAFVRHLGLGGK